MRYPAIFSILLLLIFAGCNKKYTTIPQLKYETSNLSVVHRGETLVMKLSFTDSEGDLSDSLFVQKIVKVCTNGINGSFKQLYKLPEFPTTKNQKGEISVTYDYSQINPRCTSRNDTATFRFVLKDKAQNKSDTVTSPSIVIIY